jgi:Fe-Mn family superoxide dismutase
MFTLKELPFKKNSLDPFISENTLNFHYDKHHQGYVNKLNNLVSGTELDSLSLEEIIKTTYNNSDKKAIFNNAAQVYNHDFFWSSLSPNEEDKVISDELLEMINNSFGSLDEFYEKFKEAATSQFGSGWAWLVKDGDALKIMKTANADTPIAQGIKPILTIDVWEHAYYLDYQNKRADFVDKCLKNIINWKFANYNVKD